MSLLDEAKKVQSKAYAPYSNFQVGAAIRADSGAIYTGVNVENAAYPEGTCAEAGAIAAMVLGGDTRIAEVAVIGDSDDPVPPCGGCRQKIREFAGPEVKVSMLSRTGKLLTMTVGELLPGAFTPDHME
ncbi:cytidine deaminase [Celeribacter neptunius]|uniref:Cytidine deaminase n=1 Tax=Celeribacter neptunius TaxID=588602 RepID=A0A1I3WC67_9RHOB|nr:cytidine deaminase [Celeribacter neptunius]SFK04016.1 cytidine deaminase [Celeribacter neptunius]